MNAALSGSLRSFGLPDALTFLHLCRKTGRLVLELSQCENTIYFESGAVVYAESNQEKFRLSELLLRRNRITRAQDEKVKELVASTGGKYGQVALEGGLLGEEELREFLKIQVSEIIYETFGWEEGVFRFVEESDLPAHAVTIAIDVQNLIMEGARRIDEWEQCVALLPNEDAVFRIVANPQSDGQIALTAEEWRILSQIDGERTLAGLCQGSDGEALEVYRLVYGLKANKLIEEMPREAPPLPQPPLPAPPAPSTSAAPAAELATGPHAEEGTSMFRPALLDTGGVVPAAPADDTPLLVSAKATHPFRDANVVSSARLTVESPTDVRRSYTLSETEYTIGRQRQNSIPVADVSVSALHARIVREGPHFAVEDAGSRNGVYCNGKRVQRKILEDNDALLMGKTSLRFNVVTLVESSQDR